MADVAELADVELGVEEAIQIEIRNLGSTLSGIFAQGHVGQVEQPADLEVVGELLEVLGEMMDRQPGAGRDWCGRRRATIGRMHELSPRHMMQLSFSPRRRAVTPWK